jgi:peptidoglycan/xylan/chitin deacetylase (PgdA/CDA1 family)
MYYFRRNKPALRLLPLFFILFSCQSINSNRTELGIPSPVVYFSFDDGPDAHGDTTARLLDVLQKYQIRALFFMLGENAEQYPALVKRIHDEGHYIANHGYSEKHAYKMSDDEFRENLLRGEAAISGALGFEMNPKLYRPHGGFYNSRQEKICIDEGYTIAPVTVRVYDAVVSAAEQKKIVNKTINLVQKRGGGLILLHDGRDSYTRRKTELARNPNGAFNRSWIPEAVEEIIIALLEKGFLLQAEMPLFN